MKNIKKGRKGRFIHKLKQFHCFLSFFFRIRIRTCRPKLKKRLLKEFISFSLCLPSHLLSHHSHPTFTFLYCSSGSSLNYNYYLFFAFFFLLSILHLPFIPSQRVKWIVVFHMLRYHVVAMYEQNHKMIQFISLTFPLSLQFILRPCLHLFLKKILIILELEEIWGSFHASPNST